MDELSFGIYATGIAELSIQEQLLRRNVKRFRGGLVFKAHRLLHHSAPGLRVIKKKKRYCRIRRGLDFFWIGSREPHESTQANRIKWRFRDVYQNGDAEPSQRSPP